MYLIKMQVYIVSQLSRSPIRQSAYRFDMVIFRVSRIVVMTQRKTCLELSRSDDVGAFSIYLKAVFEVYALHK